MIKTILWDIGGVILRTVDRTPREALAKQFDLSYEELAITFFGDDDKLRVQRGEITIAQHFNNVANKLKMPTENIPSFREQFFAGDEIDQKLIAWINSNRGLFQMAILSNAMLDLRAKLENTYRISKYFQEIFISAEMGLTKPSPDIFNCVMNELGRKPEEIIFIDDNLDNIQVAKLLDMYSILFENRTQALRDIEKKLSEK